MLTKRPFAREIISLVLASALALGFSILPIHAMGLGEEGTSGALCAAQRTDSEIDSLVSSMIASSDYIEGEAIVCCLGSEGISVQSDDEASDLLAGAETLSSVTARQYAEATGESIPAATEQGLLTAQSEGESVRILKVCDYGLTTEQLLRVLLRDSRVLSAEPNYLMSFEEDGNQDLDDAQVDMGGQDAEEEVGDDDPLVPSDELGPALSDAQLDVDPHAVITDFTKYQWFSEGVGYTIPQYPNASNPGIRAPHWNNPSATNASGVVVIMDSGIDYTHPDLAGVMYHFPQSFRPSSDAVSLATHQTAMT